MDNIAKKQLIKFKASFPPIQSAIKIGQDGMRIQLDIPESEMANAVELLACRNAILNVIVEIEAKPPIASSDFSFGNFEIPEMLS